MPSTYYIGTSPEESLGDSPRYFYGLRRNDQGELFFVRSDQLADIDYFDGIDSEHEILYENMKYPQYKWDNRSLFFYVDSQGQLVIRINRGYTYPVGISAEG